MTKKIYLTIIWSICLLVIIFSCGIRFAGWFTFSTNKAALSDTVTVKEYDNLKVELGFGDISFATSKDDGFSVEYETSSERYAPQVKVTGDTLYISQKKIKNLNVTGNKLSVTVYTPKGYKLGNVHIEAGAGNVDVDNISAKKLDMDFGAGDVKVVNSTIPTISVDVGAGDVVFTDNTFEKIDIDAGTGDVKISGVGDIDQYDYDIDMGVGDVKIGGNKFHGEYEVSGTTDKKISVDCGVGDLDVSE